MSKDGFKSSEFISAWAVAVIAAAGGQFSDSPMVQSAALLSAGIAIGLYSLGRGIAKRS